VNSLRFARPFQREYYGARSLVRWERRVLTSSRDIKRRLEREGWTLERVAGSHHVFKHPSDKSHGVLPHPKKDAGRGLVRNNLTRRMADRLNAP
jgi:predicted RNA binding protein YcfA (HicA-like mRNA interferase family)